MGINVHVLDHALPVESAALRAFANPNAIGSAVLVAAVAGKKIRVLALRAITTAANNIKLKSGATDITALFPLAANGQLPLDFNPHGLCETVAGEALNIDMSAASATGVQVVYTLI